MDKRGKRGKVKAVIDASVVACGFSMKRTQIKQFYCGISILMGKLDLYAPSLLKYEPANVFMEGSHIKEN